MFVNEETLRLNYQVEAEESGLSVIDVMATQMQLSSRLIRKCKTHQQISLNGHKISVNAKVKEGDIITVMLDHDENTFEPNPIHVDVLYEDADMLVVNKPPFLVVHPTKGHPDGTLANAVSHLQYNCGQNYKIRFINRLDRDTSGVLLIAKNAYAQQIISDQMQSDEVDKHYVAVVKGRLELDDGIIDAPIDRLEEGDILRGVISTGLPSRTRYKVLAKTNDASLIYLTLETGRTHQIRVHLKHIGHEIIGDTLYGIQSDLINRQALHCLDMSFKSPRKTEKIIVTAKLPDDILNLLSRLGLDGIEI